MVCTFATNLFLAPFLSQRNHLAILRLFMHVICSYLSLYNVGLNHTLKPHSIAKCLISLQLVGYKNDPTIEAFSFSI